MNGTPNAIREFLLWLADTNNAHRARDWGHGDRDELRGEFVTAGFPQLSDDEWDLVRRGDFAVLRDICSDKVLFNLVMMTSVPEPPRK